MKHNIRIRALARDLRKTKARINRLHGTCGVSPDAAGCLEQSGGKRRRRRKRTKKKTRRRRKRRKRRKIRRKSRKRKAGASSARRNINHNRNILGKTATINEIVTMNQHQNANNLIEVEVEGYAEPFNRGIIVDRINQETVIVEMQYPNDDGEITVSVNDITPIP